VILATQRPSVDVISGLIKSNFPMRIAFRVASRVDSTTILDAPGAEKLIGKGDMLFSAGIDTERIQCGYVSGDEIEEITSYISSQQGYAKSYNTPYYLPSVEEAEGESGGGATDMGDVDERFKEAAELVVTTQKASTSYLQTRLGMGFAKAARVMGQLEAAGVVGPQDGAKPRQVLIPDLNSLQSLLDAFVK
jgi:S-DNA-T family DNA segregation ATPase FtsK/SpoIIIE